MEKPTEKKIKHKFLKEDIIASKMFNADVDILQVVLEDGKTYAKEEVEKLIDTYKKKVVN